MACVDAYPLYSSHSLTHATTTATLGKVFATCRHKQQSLAARTRTVQYSTVHYPYPWVCHSVFQSLPPIYGDFI